VVGAFVVLVIARAYYRAEKWARGVALLCFAFPAMGGAYMLVPAINFTGFGTYVIYSMIISLLGLIPYFTILLAEKSDAMQKVVNFFVFLFLGVQGAHSFANSHAVDAPGPPCLASRDLGALARPANHVVGHHRPDPGYRLPGQS
jgi:hypothetical protein